MKKFIQFLVSVLLIAVIVASVGWYLFVYDRDFTRDMLLSQARYNDLYGNSRLSSWFYDLAYEHSGRDENVAIELSNQYKADGNYTKAEVTLSNAIKNKGTVELYTALCKTYVEQDKLLDAVALLDNIADSEMKAALSSLRPTAPTVSHEPGYYSKYIDVALSSSQGTLYYTTDGEYPTIQREAYSKPITLEAGETIIYAISVSDSGLVSQPVVAGYTVGGVIEPAVFTDKTMEGAIRQALGVSDSELLYTNVLWNITEFTVPAGVTDLTDLELLPYLTSLTIHDQNLTTLSPISLLPRLQHLDLSGCSFPADELSVVTELSSLTSLKIANCGLSTIAGLEGAQKLEVLDVSSNTVRNMDAVKSIRTLKELNLQHNAVTKLDDLSTLSKLEKLDISFNAVSDIRPLATCLKLTWLDAGNNKIDDISTVEVLTQLNHLALDHNALDNISPAAHCLQLTNLSFANNKVSNISSLSALVNLDYLNFSNNTVSSLPEWSADCMLRTIEGSHNEVTSLNTLAKLSHLSYVYMDYNKITNIDALADSYRLVQVNVYGNDIDTVSALTEHDIIVNYDPT